MSVYDNIREGLAEDFRKARDYPNMKAKLEAELVESRKNPSKEVWLNGYYAGWDAHHRLYKGEKPRGEEDYWGDFIKSATLE